jgi:flagellum-specific ATP synthase
MIRNIDHLMASMPDLRPAPVRVGILSAHKGQFLEASGFPYPIGTAAKIGARDGRLVAGEVIGFQGNRAIIQPFENVTAIGNGAPVYPDGRHDLVPVGPEYLGRIVGPFGEPLDGLPAPGCAALWQLSGSGSNPLERSSVTNALDCGVRAINGLMTMGEGQRVAIIAGSGVGKSVLMGQILQGTEAEVIVVGLIGERAREVSDFVSQKLTAAAREKSIMVAVAADQPSLLRVRAAMRAAAIAEYFAAEGKRVLLLLDSLTRVAHAQREIGLSLGEPPTMKGYTPSALSLIPQLVERAGVNTRSGGSVTAIYTVLADGGDLDDPIVDAARAIADGHIVLSRDLAEAGVFPAIDVGRSLSRVMSDIVDAEHLSAAARFRQLSSSYEQNRDLLLMGAYAAGSDPLLDCAIAAQPDMLDYIRQPASETVDLSDARQRIVESFGA